MQFLLSALLLLATTGGFAQMTQGARLTRDLQIEIEDLRQKVHGYEVENDLLVEQVHKQEALLTKLQKDFSAATSASQEVQSSKMTSLEKRLAALEQRSEHLLADLKQLQGHANETTSSLASFKGKMGDLEQSVSSNLEGLKDVVKSAVKGVVRPKSYCVKPGDSLERIARANHTSVARIKALNKLTKDRIVVGQELRLEE